MYPGISNIQIEKFIKEKKVNLKKKLLMFSHQLINFHNLIIEQNAAYPFMIINTDRSEKQGTHWWSILDPHRKKNIFLFDSFCFKSRKSFIIQYYLESTNSIKMIM